MIEGAEDTGGGGEGGGGGDGGGGEGNGGEGAEDTGSGGGLILPPSLDEAPRCAVSAKEGETAGVAADPGKVDGWSKAQREGSSEGDGSDSGGNSGDAGAGSALVGATAHAAPPSPSRHAVGAEELIPLMGYVLVRGEARC